MGKFFKEKVQRNHPILDFINKYKFYVLGGVVLIILIIVLISVLGRSKIKIYNSITVQLNNEKPVVDDFIKEIKNFDKNKIIIDYNDLDMSILGKYTVYVSIPDEEKKKISVKVEDTTGPTLEVTDLKIEKNASYTLDDFVISCLDNSLEDCNVTFDDTLSDDGSLIDYLSFKDDGVYDIKIKATDIYNNVTVKTAKLTIGNGSNPNYGKNCKYGNYEYDEATYNFPIAVNVFNTNTGCAIDRNLWDDETIQNPVTKLYNDDYAKLKEDTTAILNKKYPYGVNIVITPHFISVLNTTNKGLIGYGIYIKMYVSKDKNNIDNENNLALAYYIKEDGSRDIRVNNLGL